MKAIQKTSGGSVLILHPNVVEIKSDRPNRRKFKCTRCGMEWYEAITSPVVLGEVQDVKNYYPNYSLCHHTQNSLASTSM